MLNRDVARLIARCCDPEALVAWSQVCSTCRRGLDEAEWDGWAWAAAQLAGRHPRANEVIWAGMKRLRQNVVRSSGNHKRFCLAAVAILARRKRLEESVPVTCEPIRVGVMGERHRQRFCALFDGCPWSADYIPTLWDARPYMVVDASGRLSQTVVLRDTISSAGYCCSEEWRLRVEGVKPAQDVFVALVEASVGSQKLVVERMTFLRAKCPETKFLVCGVDDLELAPHEWEGCHVGPNWVREDHATAVAVLMRALELATTEATRSKCNVM